MPLADSCVGAAGLADDNAKIQAAATNMLNLALTLPDAPADLAAVLVSNQHYLKASQPHEPHLAAFGL